MHGVKRPILGFSWRGVVLLLPVAVIVACLAKGIDLRAAMLRAIADWWGVQAMFDTVTGPITRFGIAVRGEVPGPANLLYLLPAMHLAPQRWRVWEWALAVAGPMLTSYWWWPLIIKMNRLGLPTGLDEALMDFGVSLVMFAVAWALTHEWRVAWKVLVVNTVIAAGIGVLSRVFQAGGSWATWASSLFVGLAVVWHAALAWILVGWAVRARRAYRPDPDACGGCGYSLVGTGAGVCPECGLATSSACPC